MKLKELPGLIREGVALFVLLVVAQVLHWAISKAFGH